MGDVVELKKRRTVFDLVKDTRVWFVQQLEGAKAAVALHVRPNPDSEQKSALVRCTGLFGFDTSIHIHSDHLFWVGLPKTLTVTFHSDRVVFLIEQTCAVFEFEVRPHDIEEIRQALADNVK